MGCYNLTYLPDDLSAEWHERHELKIVHVKKGLSLKNSSENACSDYPFGMRFGNAPVYQLETNNYLYNGKELQDETQWYEYGARMYDAQLGRWHAVDPMAESYYSFTPYNYVMNNPMNMIDPNGMYAESTTWIMGAGHGGYWDQRRHQDGGGSMFKNMGATFDDAAAYEEAGGNLLGMTLGEFAELNQAGKVNVLNEEESQNFKEDNYTYHYSAEGTLDANGDFDGTNSITTKEWYTYNNTNIVVQSAGWTTTGGGINDGIGGFGTGMADLDGSFRLYKGGRVNLKYYESNWTGGSRARITTYSAAKWGSRITKGSVLISVGLHAYNINQANIQDSRTFGYNTQVATGQAAGNLVGAWAGAEAGAAVGAAVGVWFFGVGAAPGAIIGGIVGGFFGGWGGSELGGAAVNIFY